MLINHGHHHHQLPPSPQFRSLSPTRSPLRPPNKALRIRFPRPGPAASAATCRAPTQQISNQSTCPPPPRVLLGLALLYTYFTFTLTTNAHTHTHAPEGFRGTSSCLCVHYYYCHPHCYYRTTDSDSRRGPGLYISSRPTLPRCDSDPAHHTIPHLPYLAYLPAQLASPPTIHTRHLHLYSFDYYYYYHTCL